MPTVPPTCISLDPLLPVPLSNYASGLLAPDGENTAGPTPDPDTDDLVLVPADVGNPVSQYSLESTPPQPIATKPRIELGTIVLHSPSSIVGTPFDPSPRFEYPFPAPFPPGSEFDPLVPSIASPYVAYPVPPLTIPPTAISIGGSGGTAIHARTKGDLRSFSPTHIKLDARDPPVPPGLVKRRLHRNGNGVAVAVDSTSEHVDGRPRGDSTLSLSSDSSDKLGRQDGGTQGAKSKWKRNSLALGEPSRRSRTPDTGTKVYHLGHGQNRSSPALAHEVFGYGGHRAASPAPTSSVST